MNTLKILYRSILGAALVLAVPSAADAQVEIAHFGATRLYFTVDTVGTVQALEHEDAFDATGKPFDELGPGFQTAWGNMGFSAAFGEEKEIEMFFDLFISSRNHPSTTYGHQGYLVVRAMPGDLKKVRVLNTLFEHVDVKLGHFHIDFGDHQFHRSDNAAVQSNPLIGNFVIDPELVDIGAEISSEPGKFNWMLGLSNGTNTENVQEGKGVAVHGKVWLDVEPFRAAFSAIQVDHSENATTKAQLFSGNRDGERYGGILGGGQAPGQVLPQAGRDLLAWQADFTYGADKLKLYAHYGDTKDSDTNGPAAGTPVEHWNYYAAESVYQFTPKAHAAARYSSAAAKTLRDLPSDGKVDRVQVGGGYWLTEQMLIKLEYVHEAYRDFKVGDVLNNNLQAWRDPSFSGGLMEVSFGF